MPSCSADPHLPAKSVLQRPTAAKARGLARKLLSWFDRHHRDLPWRHDRDPYRIWVSEVMLQQTQVATVLRFYERFLWMFPTLHDLAAADEQDVLRLWQGLGYYRRALNLHAAARWLAANLEGRVPSEPAIFAELPGVGRYMLGAVFSQAYEQRLPVVDANSERVLCRYFGEARDPRRGAGRRWLWDIAEAVLPSRRVGDFNQALMELGALVCTSAKPQCERCPLASQCVAKRRRASGRAACTGGTATDCSSSRSGRRVTSQEPRALGAAPQKRAVGRNVGVPANGAKVRRNARGRRDSWASGSGGHRGRLDG